MNNKLKYHLYFPALAALLLSTTACTKGRNYNENTLETSTNLPASTSVITTEPEASMKESPIPTKVSYVNPSGTTLETRFQLPEGYTRLSYSKDSFGEFVRKYPLCEDGSEVLLYNGSKKGNQNAHIAIFDMDLVNDDLQQCADSVIRMYAEYFYKKKQYELMQFHFVNGFSCDFSKWSQGMRVNIDGNSTTWYQGAASDDSNKTLESYLRTVFCYASTLSLEEESKSIQLKDIQIGDIFIHGGSPGHVVMVVDVCKNKQKEKAFLLAQGYMPAQQFHILQNPQHTDDPWYYTKDLSNALDTPEYDFTMDELKRPTYIK
ncbi:MAG: DUF4846 domain-containing protein [Clostridiales bacterium]|nr:DUF4846 domain-containing protein [Clostridiales bacterium]